MCEICHHTPCHPQCPNADEPKPVFTCSWCGGEIYVGDEFYDLDTSDKVCKDCMGACLHVAEEPERDDE